MDIKKLPEIKTLEMIANDIGTPFHYYDAAAIRKNAREVLRAFSWNDGFREYFAVKALPNPAILKLLKEEGVGVDCASMTELLLAEACGFSGEEIMFSSNVTPAAEYEYASRLGAVINLDDDSHIDFLRETCGIPEKICLRYNPGGEISIGNFVMGNPAESKFGMTRPQILKAVQTLRSMGAKRFGLHAFLASNAIDIDYFPYIARTLFELAAEIKKTCGVKVEMINLSGGIGIPYLPEQEKTDILKVGQLVKEAFDEIMVRNELGNATLASELGRYMTGPYGVLVSRVLHIKDSYKTYAGLDACAVDLMRPAIYGSYHHISVPGKDSFPSDHVYDVVGALCENNDKFAIDRSLPRLEKGDLVVIHDTGAHGYSMGYNYNGKLKSPEVLGEEDGTYRLIRRRETPEDYFATLDVLGEFRKD